MTRKNLFNLIKLLCLFPALLFLGACSSSSSSDPAPSGSTVVLYAATGQDGDGLLIKIFPNSGGKIEVVGPIMDSNGNADCITALVFDGTTLWGGTCYEDLVTIDRANGQFTFVGDMGTLLTDFAFRNGVLYGLEEGDSGSMNLFTVNTTTGAATLVGAHGVGTTTGAGLAFSGGTLYSANDGDNLYTVDTATGAFTLVAAMSASVDVQGVDMTSCGGKMYLMDRGDNLYSINTADAVLTLEHIGRKVSYATDAVACAPNVASAGAPRLYISDGQGIADGNAQLQKINLYTGEVSTVGSMNRCVTGLTFAGNTLYGVSCPGIMWLDNALSAQLLSVNPDNGSTTVVGDFGANIFITDIAYLGGVLYGWDKTTSDLFIIDTGTGAATLVADSGLLFTSGTGLAANSTTLFTFDSNSNTLRTVNEGTGLTIVLGSPAGMPNNRGRSLAFCDDTNLVFVGIGASWSFSGGIYEGTSVGTLNIINGAQTLLGSVMLPYADGAACRVE